MTNSSALKRQGADTTGQTGGLDQQSPKVEKSPELSRDLAKKDSMPMMFNNLDISEIKWTAPDMPEENKDTSMINSIYMDFKEHMGYGSRRSNSAPRNSNGSTDKE